MNKLCLILILFSSSAISCPSIIGTWKSSLEKSKSFNDARALIEEKARVLRLQIIGKSTVTYTENTILMEMEPIEKVYIEGKEYNWDSSDIDFPYKIIGCTPNSVAIKYEIAGREEIGVLNFEDENTYWVYEGKAGGTGNDHAREYFVRAKNN